MSTSSICSPLALLHTAMPLRSNRRRRGRERSLLRSVTIREHDEPLAVPLPASTRTAWTSITANQQRCDGDRTISTLVSQASTAPHMSQQIEALRSIAMFKLAPGIPKLDDITASSAASSLVTAATTSSTAATGGRQKKEKAGVGAAMMVSEHVRTSLFNGLFDLLFVEESAAVQKHLVRGIEIFQSGEALATKVAELLTIMRTKPPRLSLGWFGILMNLQCVTPLLIHHMAAVFEFFTNIIEANINSFEMKDNEQNADGNDDDDEKKDGSGEEKKGDESDGDDGEDDGDDDNDNDDAAESLMSGGKEGQDALRTFVTYVTRVRGDMTTVMNDASFIANDGPLMRLLRVLVNVLKLKNLHKDPVTQASLLVFFLLSVAPSAEAQLSYIYVTFFAPVGTAITSEQLSSSPVLRVLHTPPVVETSGARAFESSMSTLARVACLRAIISHSSLPSLLSSLPNGTKLLYTAAFDALLPYCEHTNPLVRLYAFQAMEMWLGRAVKIVKSYPAATFPADIPPPVAAIDIALPQIMALVPNNWEHTFRMIGEMMKTVYTFYIDIRNMRAAQSSHGKMKSADWTDIVRTTLNNKNDPNHRGRYMTLRCLLPVYGAVPMLAIEPDLVHQMLISAINRPVWGLSLTVLEAIVSQSVKECVTLKRPASLERHDDQDATGADEKKEMKTKSPQAAALSHALEHAAVTAYQEQVQKFASLWMDGFIRALHHHDPDVRQGAAGPFLSFVLKRMDTGVMPLIMTALSSYTEKKEKKSDPTVAAAASSSKSSFATRHLRALIAVLRTARLVNAVTTREIDASLSGAANATLPIDRNQIVSALLSSDDDLRMEALDFMCSNQKKTEIVSNGELSLLRQTLPYLLKIHSTNTRGIFGHHIHRLFSRLRDSCNRFVRTELSKFAAKVAKEAKTAAATPTPTPVVPPAITPSPSTVPVTDTMSVDEWLLVSRERSAPIHERSSTEQKGGAAITAPATPKSRFDDGEPVELRASLSFIRWIEDLLIHMMYPGAPFERTSVVMELYRLFVEMWQEKETVEYDKLLYHVGQQMYSTDRVLILLNSGVNSYDRIRLLSCEVLLKFPSPLPGYQSTESLSSIIRWASDLSRHPRVRDSDGGALTLRMIFRKYVMGLRWQIPLKELCMNPSYVWQSSSLNIAATSDDAILFLIDQMSELLADVIAFLHETPLHERYNTSKARVHGMLMFFRYALMDLPWSSWDHSNTALVERWRIASARLLQKLFEIANASLQLHIYTEPAYSLTMASHSSAAITSSFAFPASQSSSSSSSTSESTSITSGVAVSSSSLSVPSSSTIPVVASSTTDSVTAVTMSVLQAAVAVATEAVSIAPPSFHKAKPSVPLTPVTEPTTPVVLSPPVNPFAAAIVVAGAPAKAVVATPATTRITPLVASSSSSVSSSSSTTTTTTASTAPTPGVAVAASPAIASIDCRGHVIFERNGDEPNDFADEQGEQMVVTSSWLAVKEVALVMGKWVRVAPLPSANGNGLFTVEHIRAIGNLFFTILQSSKHMGVLDKAHAALLEMCERLMVSREAAMIGLVMEWLDGLLRTIRNQEHTESWIRRSAGLPYCFMALLQAEPARRQSVLMGHAMRELLALARNSVNWRTTVHGLNVLRAIFRDSTVALDSMPFVADGVMVAISGFSHTQWAVRNSSLMALTAILQRGLKLQTRAQAGRKGITGGDFFGNFPTLHPFFTSQLQAATSPTKLDATASSSSSSSSAAVSEITDMHPSLYPLLLLLSRLVPAYHEEKTASLGMYSFLPYIQRCAGHSNYMARHMAAKAIVSLVPIDALITFVPSLIESLPSSPTGTGTTAMSHNLIHGVLMQVSALINRAELNTLEPELVDAILTKTLIALHSRIWLGSVAMVCAPVRLLFIELYAAFLADSPSFVKSLPFNLRQYVVVLAVQACDPAPMIPLPSNDTSSSSSSFFPMIGAPSLRAVAASIATSAIIGSSVDDTWLTQMDTSSLLLSLLRDASSEIRERVLATIRRAILKSSTAKRLSAVLRVGRLRSQLLSEFTRDDEPINISHGTSVGYMSRLTPEFVHLALSTLVVLENKFADVDDEPTAASESKADSGDSKVHPDDIARERIWTAISSLVLPPSSLAAGTAAAAAAAATGGSVGIKAQAIKLLAVHLRKEMLALRGRGLPRRSERVRTFQDRAASWLELLVACCDVDSPTALRRACCTAIGLSQFLAPQPPPLLHAATKEETEAAAREQVYKGEVNVGLWKVIIVLLQDDSPTILHAAVGVASKYLTSDSDTAATGNQSVEARTLEKAYAHLAQVYWATDGLVDYLLDTLREHTKFEHIIGNDQEAEFKLFEKEKSNETSEAIMTAELTAHYLSKVLAQRFALPAGDDRRTYVDRHVASWLDEFSGRFVECFTALQPRTVASQSSLHHYRARIIQEILETERTYVHFLRVVVQVFIAWLPSSTLTTEHSNILFGEIPHLYSLNKTFLASLEERIASYVPALLLEQAGLVAPAAQRAISGASGQGHTSHVAGVSTIGSMASALSPHHPTSSAAVASLASPTGSVAAKNAASNSNKFSDQWLPSEVALDIRVGDLFLQFGAFFKMYSAYAIGHTHATELLSSLAADPKQAKFHKWLHEQQSDTTCKGHSIHSLLIQPIQRIPRYQLLMKELLKYTPEGHPDFGDIPRALALIGEAAAKVNESVKAHENQLVLLDVQKLFGNQCQLVTPSRRFIRRGQLAEKHRLSTQRIHMFLFNDLLIGAEPRLASNTMKLLFALPITSDHIFVVERVDPSGGVARRSVPELAAPIAYEPSPSVSHSFRIYTNHRSMVLRCTDDSECQSWLDALQRCVDTQTEAADQRHVATYWRHIREAQIIATNESKAKQGIASLIGVSTPSLGVTASGGHSNAGLSSPRAATSASSMAASDEHEASDMGMTAGGQTFTTDVFAPAYALTLVTQVLYQRAAPEIGRSLRQHFNSRRMAAARLLAAILPHERHDAIDNHDERAIAAGIVTSKTSMHPLLRRELSLLSQTMHVAGRLEARQVGHGTMGLPASIHDNTTTPSLPSYRPGFLLPFTEASSTTSN